MAAEVRFFSFRFVLCVCVRESAPERATYGD